MRRTASIGPSLPRLGLAILLATVGVVALRPGVAAAATNLTVSTTADVAATAGACGNAGITTPPSPLSLREATCLANNIGGAVNINIPAGTYNLVNGELQPGIANGSNVSLVGAGAGATIINAGTNSRVIDLDKNLVGGVSTTISGLTITGGADSTFGGAGIIGGSNNNTTADILNLTNVIVTGNAANGANMTVTNKPGGGVQFLGGQLTITNSTISNNTSGSSYGSGVAYGANGVASPEGLTIINTSFSGNSVVNSHVGATAEGGALGLFGTAGANFSVTGSRFVNNSATSTNAGPAVGGAIWEQSGNLTVSGSTFTGNSVSGGSAADLGGAVEVTSGTATMHFNRLVGNVAPAGGGVLHNGGTTDATENWWGCNTGPGTAGCDTVAGAPTVSPRLVLTASASPSTVVGPNGTSTISAALTSDNLGAAQSGTNLGAFAALPATFSDPPGDATVTLAPGAHTAGFSSGVASIDYHSGATTVGVDPVNASFDNATVSTVVTVNQAPAITSLNSAHFNVGTAGSFTVTSAGSPTPALSQTGTLPAGLTFTDNGDGTATLAGTATGPGGTFPLSLTANNGVSPNATQTLTVTVGQPPAFTSPGTATFTTGAAGSFTVTTSGIPTVSAITETGTLPSGLSFTDNGNGTATFAGTPGAGSGGSYPVTLGATNGVAPNASQAVTVQVNQAPAITTSPSDQTVNPGTPVTFIAAASGVPTPTVQWQRSTNGGASYTNIAGATSTSYTFTTAAGDDGNRYRAVFTNVVSSATSTAATLNVGTAPAFTSANASTFAVGTAGNVAITTSGVPSATISRTGTFPAWLTLTDNGDGTGSLTGTPPAGAGGSYTFTLNAANGFSPTASQIFTLSVDESPTITSANHVTFTAGFADSFAVTTTGGFPLAVALTETGALPGGLSFVDNGDGTASLAGNANVGTAGDYPLTIRAAAVGGVTAPASQNFTLSVDGPPAITSADHAAFSVGAAGTFTVTTVSGLPTATNISKIGTLPAGVTLIDNGNGTATLAGTPAFGTGGTYMIAIKASNGIAPSPSQAFTLIVNEPPTITSTNHTTFAVGAAAAFTVTTAPGEPAATTLTQIGALPPGTAFTDNGDGTATLGGTPTAGGKYVITIKASNGVAPDPTQTFTVTVNEPPTITNADHVTFDVGAPGTITITTVPGTPVPVTITETGALPTGVTFLDNTDGTATLAGTPAAGQSGIYALQVIASNGVLPNSTQAFTLTVDELPHITSAAATTFPVNAAGTFTVISTTGFPAATTITKVGALPAGITFTDNGDGSATLTGTPPAGSGGRYPLTITAGNAAGHQDQAFVLTVTESPAITSADATTFAAGTSSTFTVSTAGGFPTRPALSETGALPTGITFADNGDGTATLAGTPTADGSYPLTISADNGNGVPVTQSFTLTVDGPPSITSAASMTFTAGVPGIFTVTTMPGVPGTSVVSRSGALPTGITFTDNGDGTATIAGTSPVAAVGTYPVTLTASNGIAPDGTQAFTLTVAGADTLTLPPAPPASDGALKGVAPNVAVGMVLHVSGTGYAAGAPITLGIYSAPTRLASTVANSSGSFAVDVTVPNKLDSHVFLAAGIGADGQPRYLETRSVIHAAAVTGGGSGTGTGTGSGTGGSGTGGSGTGNSGTTGSGGLAQTGSNDFGASQLAIGLVLAGLLLLIAARRRAAGQR